MWKRRRIALRHRRADSSLRRRSGAGLVAALLSAATLASAAAVDLASTDSARQTRAAESDRVVRAPAGNPLWAIPIEALAATQDRPLFSPTRRPPARPAAAMPPAPPQPPRAAIEPEKPPFALIGTVVGKHDAIGVFFDQSTHGTVRLYSGQGREGWVLARVRARDVVLRKGDAVVLLALSAEPVAPVVIAAQETASRREIAAQEAAVRRERRQR